MNSLVRIARLVPNVNVGRRGLQAGVVRLASTQVDVKDLKNFDPNNYNIPLRQATMDDMMEPYGSWKQAYEAERRLGNRTLLMGILCFSVTCVIFCYSGITEGLYMPNLDNLMEDTEPFEPVDKEGRITV